MPTVRGAIARFQNIISPPQTGKALSDKFLSKLLRREVLGTWALDAASLNYLAQYIHRERPQFALEFGAGISTICLARWLSQVHNDTETARLFSIEQNQWQIDQTREQLNVLGLGDVVSILHAPLAERTVEGRSAITYSEQTPQLSQFFGQARPSFVLVDGPAGDDLTRFSTIPDVRTFLADGAVIFLDDKYRPEEEAVIAEWGKLPYIVAREGGTESLAQFAFISIPTA